MVVGPPVVREARPRKPQKVERLRSATKYEISSRPARRRQRKPMARTAARYAARKTKARVCTSARERRAAPSRPLESPRDFPGRGLEQRRSHRRSEERGVGKAVRDRGSHEY